MITFYDLTSSLEPHLTWDPRSWKIRLMLNHYKVPYHTQWIDYPDIEPTYKRFGLAAVHKAPNGADLWTVPILYDPSTAIAIADSFDIARYLDETYASVATAKILPDGTDALQAAFSDATFRTLLPGLRLLPPLVANNLRPESKTCYLKERCVLYYGTVDEGEIEQQVTGERKRELWREFERGLDRIDGWFRKNEDRRDTTTSGQGSFVMGREPSFADYNLAAYLVWCRNTLGAEDGGWKEICGWNEGRWGEYVEFFDTAMGMK